MQIRWDRYIFVVLNFVVLIYPIPICWTVTLGFNGWTIQNIYTLVPDIYIFTGNRHADSAIPQIVVRIVVRCLLYSTCKLWKWVWNIVLDCHHLLALVAAYQKFLWPQLALAIDIQLGCCFTLNLSDLRGLSGNLKHLFPCSKLPSLSPIISMCQFQTLSFPLIKCCTEIVPTPI